MVKGTYYRALRVSDDDCLDNTPTLIIEDDVLFSSNMDQKVSFKIHLEVSSTPRWMRKLGHSGQCSDTAHLHLSEGMAALCIL